MDLLKLRKQKGDVTLTVAMAVARSASKDAPVAAISSVSASGIGKVQSSRSTERIGASGTLTRNK